MGKDAKRYHTMLTVYKHMLGDVHGHIRAHSSKRSQGIEQKNRARGTEKRSKDNNSQINASYEYDIYDLVLEHLIDEGYAETPEAAEVMMVNMSEEWRDSILNNI